jgi:predicted SAM-dependent methyltransferase
MVLLERFRQSYKIRRAVTASRRFGNQLAVACSLCAGTAIRPWRRMRLRSELARREDLHVHFGCGRHNDIRFLNADARPFPHVHLVTKSPMLEELPRNSVALIYACHVFEHFSHQQQLSILERWFELLKPGGRIVLSVPDFDKLVDRYLTHGRSPGVIEHELMGGQDYPGNFHHAIFSRDHLAALLKRVGFANVHEWHPKNERNWPRDHSWEDHVSLNLAADRPR